MRTSILVRTLLSLLPFALVSLSTTAEDSKSSEAQQAWEKLVGTKALEKPAYAYVEDDPTLPRVLLIGDSISIGYTADVRELLKGQANVHRIPTNGGDTARGLEKLASWLGDGKWDVIHFNWGLHDLKHVRDNKLDLTAPVVATPTTYEKNLRELVGRLQKTGASLIWASTTPVPEGAKGRVPGDDLIYNSVASAIMTESSVPINDLHGYIQPELGTYQRSADVHFNDAGSLHLAKKVSAAILEALGARASVAE